MTTIEIPTTLSEAVSKSLGDTALPRWALEALVLEGVRELLISIGEAGEVLGFGYFEAEAFIKEKGAFPEVTEEDLMQDQADLREILVRSRPQ